MSSCHLIDEVVFDIAFETTALAVAQQEKMQSFLVDSLLPAVDDVFNRYSDADTVLKLDVVEIDIGDVPAEDFRNEITRRVTEQLGVLLQKKLQQAKRTPSAGTTLISRKLSDLEQLAGFLLNGTMHWHANVADDRLHEHLLDRVLRDSAHEFAAYVKRSAQRVTLIERMTRQFPERHLVRVVRQLAPSRADAVLAFIDDCRRASQEYGTGGSAHTERMYVLWQHVLRILSIDAAASAGADVFAAPVLQAFAQERGARGAAAQALVADAASRLQKMFGSGLEKNGAHNASNAPKAPNARKGNDATGADQHVQHHAPATSAPAITPIPDEGGEVIVRSGVVALRERLARAIMTADARGLDAVWGTLLRQHAALLREDVRRHVAGADVRRRLAENFPEPMLRALIRLLEPNADAFVSLLLDRPAVLSLAAASLEHGRHRLWERSLAFLSTGHRGQFNPHAFVGYLLAHPREGDRERHGSVIKAWRDELAASGAAPVMAAILDALLKGAAAAYLDVLKSTHAQPASGRSESRHASDMYALLVSRLAPGPAIAGHVHSVIDTLAAEYPAQLRRFFQALRDGKFSLANARFSENEWRRLIAALVSGHASGTQENPGALLRAISAYAEQTQHKVRYFRRVLEELLRGRSLDKEAFGVLVRSAAASQAEIGGSNESGFEDAVRPNRLHRKPGQATPQHVTDAVHGKHAAINAPATGDATYLQTVCRALRNGELPLAHVQLRESEWRRLIAMFIADGATGVTAHRAGFLRAIGARAEHAVDREAYFRQVLDDLLHDRPVDLDAAAQDRITNSPAAATDALYEKLRSGKIVLAHALLDDSELRHLIQLSVADNAPAEVEEQTMLLQAIESHAARTENKKRYFTQVLEHLLQRKALDLDAIVRQSRHGEGLPETAGITHTIAPAGANQMPAHQVTPPHVASAVHGEHATINAPATGDATSLQTVCRALRNGELSLTHVQLRESEWRRLIAMFIADGATGVTAHRAGFLRAISAHAEHAVDREAYFRQVLDDLLHDRPVDLDAAAQDQITNRPAPLDAAATDALYEKLRSGKIVLADARLDDSELRHLIQLSVADNAPASAGEQTALLQAIESHAARTENKKRYFTQVLAHLLQRKALDLDAILRQSRHGEGQPETAGAPHTMAPADTSEVPAQTDSANLHHRVAQAILHADVESIHLPWKTLMREHRALVRDALFHYGVQAQVRQRLAAGFPEPLLKELVDLLEPQAAAIVASLLAQRGLFDAATEASHQQRRGLWEFSLTHLLTGLRGTFHPNTYIKGLLATLGAGERASYRTLVQEWRAALGGGTPHREVIAGLDALHADAPDGDATPANAGDAAAAALRSERLLRAYDSYEALRQRLLTESSVVTRTDDMDAAIDVLAAEHPVQLNRFFNALRCGELPLANAQFTTSEWQTLVAAFVTSAVPDGSADRTPFLHAINAHAARAGSTTQYFRRVLEDLLHDRAVDLEAIAAQMPATDSQFEIAAPDDMQAPEDERPQAAAEGAVASGDVMHERLRRPLNGSAAARGPDEMSEAADAPAIAPLAQPAGIAVRPDAADAADAAQLQRNADWNDARLSHVSAPLPVGSGRGLRSIRGEGGEDDAHASTSNAVTAPKGPQARVNPDEDRLSAGRIALSEAGSASLKDWIENSIADSPAALRTLLTSSLKDASVSARLVQLLPERLLTRILLLLREVEHDAVQHCADLVADIFCQADKSASPARITSLKWQYIFRYLNEEQGAFARQPFTNALANYLVTQTGTQKANEFHAMLGRRNGPDARPRAEKDGRTFNAKTAQSPAAPDPAGETYRASERRWQDAGIEAEAEPAKEIYIPNAGQVLAAPYLPRLFAMLKLVEKGRFIDRHAAERAAHLLQFMVNEKTASPEYQLVLNKLLCGVKTGVPIAGGIEISAQEKETVEALIQGMIDNWTVLGKTSIKGLRESFLQRPGWLQLKDDAWHLQVQSGTFDMLLDRLPWSFSIIKHPWMERAVHVNWR